MRITRLNFHPTDLGLQPVDMSRLGELVVLAGPNGAGKTRLLTAVRNEVRTSGGLLSMPQPADADGFAPAVGDPDSPGDKFRAWAAEYEKAARRLSFEGPVAPLVRLWPKPGDLADPHSMSPIALSNAASAVREGADPITATAISAYLFALMEEYREATHQECQLDASYANRVKEEYTAIYGELQRWFGSGLTRGPNRQAIFLGRALGAGLSLSDGQNVLLQMLVSLTARARERLKDAVLLLDEPENHLHPKALRPLLARVRALAPDGQVWIATHSVHVLAQVPPESIWWMENGTAKWARRDPSRVLAGIVGDQDAVAELRGFLDRPDQLARVRFAHECLIAPIPVERREGDEQLDQIREQLGRLRAEEAPIRMLDIGAGRCRLLDELASDARHLTLYDYYAHDVGTEYQAERERALSAAYGDAWETHVVDDLDRAQKDHAGKFDVVVMCNVLHEIQPRAWLDLFGGEGSLPRLLRPDGVLLIVEDTQLAHGETAHAHDFLILESHHLRLLFADATMSATCSARRKGRLEATVVPRSLVESVSRATVIAALNAVRDTARRDLRQKRGTSYEDGLAKARAVHTFANSSVALDELTGTTQDRL